MTGEKKDVSLMPQLVMTFDKFTHLILFVSTLTQKVTVEIWRVRLLVGANM